MIKEVIPEMRPLLGGPVKPVPDCAIDANCCKLFLFCIHRGVHVLNDERRTFAKREMSAGASMSGRSSFSKS